MRETLDNLRYYFNTRNDVILFASSGRARWRARYRIYFRPATAFDRDGGKFGERWVQLAKAYGHRIRCGRSSLRPRRSNQRDEEAPRTGGPFRAVFIQATESSTGGGMTLRRSAK